MQNNFLLLCTAFLLITVMNACSKRELNPGSPATIQVYNALNDGSAVYMDFSGKRPAVFRTTRLFSVNTSGRLTLDASPLPVQLYSRPDTMAKDGPILTASLDFEKGAIYSMFIYGSKSTAKYSWHKDVIPPLGMSDSTTHIRFANFSEEHNISVNLKGQPTGSFIQQLQLRSFSDFTELSANKSVAKYEFEIKDLNTGTIIATYVADKVNDFTGNGGNNAWFNKSNTLVLVGKQGGTGTVQPKVVVMPHR
ncbi:hypothetical protein [Pseudobacter ginsenosidimutans]|uniref:DUF4397 domain-containing protein n=1 Tax=Pseudobacter ginsenosidimutans TaxID=661488 RepID=A0A4Q7N4H2_9BACT|nr:hypothetical protein [Pseudobacter ginsenosidimutans]QEC44433.1 hypothetical protein FSB84_23165 [Pseudobacter ginsenosidimutans]RZS75904.1 hypothetical protein EV199_1780 [Pseudobacter ginsenosidimutans]